MRTPIFRVTNDDDPSDCAFPRAVSIGALRDLYREGDSTWLYAAPLSVGQSITVGGGAGVQFTIERIR